jgi:hypothetical protein
VKNKIVGDPIAPPNTAVSANLSNWSFSLSRKDGIAFLQRWESIEGFKHVVIVPAEASTERDQKKQEEERLLRLKEIINNATAGSHICILQSGIDDPLVNDVLRYYSVHFIRSTEALTQSNIRRSEFNAFLRSHGTVFGIFSLDLANTHVICTVKNLNISPIEIPETIPKHKDEFVAGFTKKFDKGLLTVIPFFLSNNNHVDLYRHADVFVRLQPALETHRLNIVSEPPKWINVVNLKIETEVLDEISRLQKAFQQQQVILDKQRKIKSVLWLKHNELRDACMNLLQEVGFELHKEDIGEEDFWILGDNNEKIIMVECKGRDGDLLREDITDFHHHRVARGKDYEFPSLLMANTHNKAKTLKEKNYRIPSNVVEMAVRLEILLVRTIDLVQFVNLFQRGILTREEFLNKVQSEKGWMRINDKIEIATK